MTQVLTSPEQVDADVSGEICVVRLAGTLGQSSVQKIAEVADQIWSAGCSSVLVDASLLNRVEETCVDALRTLWGAVRISGASVGVYGASGAVGSIFARLGP